MLTPTVIELVRQGQGPISALKLACQEHQARQAARELHLKTLGPC